MKDSLDHPLSFPTTSTSTLMGVEDITAFIMAVNGNATAATSAANLTDLILEIDLDGKKEEDDFRINFELIVHGVLLCCVGLLGLLGECV